MNSIEKKKGKDRNEMKKEKKKGNTDQPTNQPIINRFIQFCLNVSVRFKVNIFFKQLKR